MATITVFTPAYNRAHTLPRTYQSLKNQNCKDFIWLIVDDGSTDNTAELVNQWMAEEDSFEIRYIKKANGGMHTAHNVAYENIDTELNICIDSDDCLSPGAITAILEKWDAVKALDYAGIIALDADMNTGKVIGSGFRVGETETTLMGYYANGGSGDKKLIYRTDVINSVPPYPEFANEKYVPLVYKYRLIDQKSKLAILDKVVCDVEYQADGSSMNMFRQYRNNPNGFSFWRKVSMQYPESEKRVFMDCVHYVSSSIFAKNGRMIAESPRKLLTILAILPGVALNVLVRYKTR